MSARARVVPFYLPQFHPIPENDALGGPGFTEWTRVRQARPLFAGHRQPVRPGELGYYDLRDAGVREAQAELALSHGVAGFCYWHYWFSGRRLLERPFQEVLASGRPRLPFCLAWVNVSWSAEWYESSDRTVIPQTYPGRDDYLAHFAALRPALEDERQIRIDGRCLFVVWRPENLPDARAFAECWRAEADRAGLGGLFLVGFRNLGSTWAPAQHGFDAASDYPLDVLGRRRTPLWDRLLLALRLGTLLRLGPLRVPYPWYVEQAVRAPRPGASIPCALSNWDNTPRWGRRGRLLEGGTPEQFGAHLEAAVRLVEDRPADERIVFLRSWNEWAEGNYVEPDERFGRGWLEAIARAVRPPSS